MRDKPTHPQSCRRRGVEITAGGLVLEALNLGCMTLVWGSAVWLLTVPKL